MQYKSRGINVSKKPIKSNVTKSGGTNTVGFRPNTELVVIEFKDTGKGMDGETLKKIFDPFFSTREKGTRYVNIIPIFLLLW